MPVDPQSAETPDTPPPPDARAARGMDWVMPIWLIAFLLVVVFGLISYLFGWWYQKSVREKAIQNQKAAWVAPQLSTSQTRMVS
jgi:hypothetical protein